jgi:hypothetical protein
MVLRTQPVDLPATCPDSRETLRAVQALRLQATLRCTETLAMELARLIYGEVRN